MSVWWVYTNHHPNTKDTIRSEPNLTAYENLNREVYGHLGYGLGMQDHPGQFSLGSGLITATKLPWSISMGSGIKPNLTAYGNLTREVYGHLRYGWVCRIIQANLPISLGSSLVTTLTQAN